MPLIELLIIENNKKPQLWTMPWGGGRGVDSFVLWSYPIWVQCLNNFVPDCRFGWKRAEINGKQGFWPESLLYVLEQNRVLSRPRFCHWEARVKPGTAFLRTLFYDQDKIDSPGNYSDNHRQRNHFQRFFRVDLKTGQDFCCYCCHLQQSAFELSEIHRAQEIWILKESNVDHRWSMTR